MLVADDFFLESGGKEYLFAIMSFFILSAVFGAPMSWHKTLGGSTLVWVSFELRLESYKVGKSQRRAEWFIRWATENGCNPNSTHEDIRGGARPHHVCGLEH